MLYSAHRSSRVGWFSFICCLLLKDLVGIADEPLHGLPHGDSNTEMGRQSRLKRVERIGIYLRQRDVTPYLQGRCSFRQAIYGALLVDSFAIASRNVFKDELRLEREVIEHGPARWDLPTLW